jgi:lipoyl(octanoyl) transferase
MAGYEEAWDLQRRLHAERAADRIPDTVLLLEHPPVYTAGKRTEAWERPIDGTPVINVDRGGKITWHGPGQLVGYPIVKLPDSILVVDYVRRLEEVLIQLCADLGLEATRIYGRSGVWVAADTEAGRPAPTAGHRQHRRPSGQSERGSQGGSARSGIRVASGDHAWLRPEL